MTAAQKCDEARADLEEFDVQWQNVGTIKGQRNVHLLTTCFSFLLHYKIFLSMKGDINLAIYLQAELLLVAWVL